MELPKKLNINVNVKMFLKSFKMNQIEFKLDKKVFKKIVKFCSQMTKFGYEFDLEIDDKKLCYRNGELVESEK